MHKGKICQTPEGGSVLFMILIAVALFAALAYTVSHSTNSGGASADREHNKLDSAHLNQYPVTIRTALMRMMAFGIPIEMLAFNAPNNFTGVSVERLVFHPQGGGAVFQEASQDVMMDHQPGNWNFNASFQIPGIGRDGGNDGNDLIAFLVGISPGVCRQINEAAHMNLTGCTSGQLVGGVPLTAADLTNIHLNMTDSYAFPNTTVEDLDSACPAALLRQPTGCFADPGTTPPTHIFYSVVIER